MNALDYILDTVLIATVFFQLRGRRLTPLSLALPVAVVLHFLATYLTGVSTAGNDVYLILAGATASRAIVACLLLMVLVEVGSRQLIVAARYLRLRGQAAPAADRPRLRARAPTSTIVRPTFALV